jgi:hypothetical protein
MLSFCAQAQPIIQKWLRNNNGQKASYWQNVAQQGSAPSYTFNASPDSADVLKVCYTADSVWVSTDGLSINLGQYLNPGTCLGQNYVFRFPRTPVVPTTKSISPKEGAIGALLNGIPMYGLSNAYSWNGSANVQGPAGYKVWNVEVFKAEGFVLDTAFGAHPQQQGAYHSHATPFRMYKSTPTTQHSPLIGYAFDGYPVYGPCGYTSPTNAASGISRMKSGYSLRNITTRTTLPYGVAVASNRYGPAVSATYPLGTYCEDYEWLTANGGTLDKYNGRQCVTPEYPNGTYAYFVTIDAAGTAAFPYMIGIEYYGAPDTRNYAAGGAVASTLKMPTNATGCLYPTFVGTQDFDRETPAFALYPTPSSGNFAVEMPDGVFTNIEIVNALGQLVYQQNIENQLRTEVSLEQAGVYFVRCFHKNNGITLAKKVIIER